MSNQGYGVVHNNNEQTEDTIDLSQYIKVVNRAKWRILSLAFIISVLVALIVLSLTPIYTATSSLLIEAEETNVVSIEQIYGLNTGSKEYYETQYEILKSRHLADKVVTKLKLDENDLFLEQLNDKSNGIFQSLKAALKSALPFLPQKDPDVLSQIEIETMKKEAIIDLFIENLRVTPVLNTQVVKISYESQSPKLAAQIANTVAETYIENYLESKFAMTSKATTWLNDSLTGLRTKLEVSESKLADFYEREKLVDLDGVVGLASEELQGLSEQLLTAENKLKQSEIIYEQVQNFNGDINALAKIPEVLNHPSIQNVRDSELEAESKVSELSKVYGPKHQKMISAKAELASIQSTMTKQIEALISGITSEYKQVQSRVSRLQTAVNVKKQEFRKLTALDSQRKILQREVDINQQLYDSFFTRLKETNEVEGFETANARVLDKAVIPTIPTKPKKSLIVAGAFILSIGFGIFLVILQDTLNNGVRSVDDVEKVLGQRMLGVVPWQPHNKKENLPLREFFDQDHHVFSEAVRTLRTSIQLLSLEKNKQVIMVTSSIPKEGKTTLSINIAFAMGQVSKTLLIDSDLRRPSIANRFGFPGFQPGLANIIAGTHHFTECIVSDAQSGIDIMPAGTLPNNPQELLLSSKFADLISNVKQKYDHVIIDTAPTQAVSDSLIISKLSDTLIYVVKADGTHHNVVKNGLGRFIEVGQRVDGVVLNQVDLKNAASSYAYNGYYDKYGYTSIDPEQKSKA